MSYDDFLRWGCPTNCKLSQFNIPLCQVQVLPNLLQWYLGVRHRDSLQGQGRLILLFQTESIRKCPSMNTLSSSVWRPIRSRCVDIFNANSRQSQPVPADPSGQLQVFRRQVSSCSCHFILSPSLWHQEIPSGEDFQSTSMAAFLIRGLRPAQNGSRWTASVFNGDQLTLIKSEQKRTCIVSGDQLEST